MSAPYDVRAVEYLGDYRLRLSFADGAISEIDLESKLANGPGPIFEQLRDRRLFAQVRVDPEIGTIVWPNGADLAPEVLHEQVNAALTPDHRLPTHMHKRRLETPDLLQDEPILGAEDDRLRRDRLAIQIANLLMSVAMGERSSVLAVVGPWGSGKTSVLHLVANHLRQSRAVRVVDFNPWLVASVEGLTLDFFSTLLAALDRRTKPAKAARKALKNYAGSAASLVGLLPGGRPASAALRATDKFYRDQASLASQRTAAEKALSKLDQPLVVVVDDIDRLQSDELLTLFKLIRLAGRLPNIHYLLAFDDGTITRRLNSDLHSLANRSAALSFLEKIVQIRVDLPPLHDSDIDALVESAFAKALAHADLALTDLQRERFESLYRKHMRSRLTQPRQIKRLFAQVQATLPLVVGEVDVVDFVALTYLRIVHPALFGRLAQSGEDLVASVRAAFRARSTSQEERLEQWHEFVATTEEADVEGIVALLAELFPPVADAVHGRSTADLVLFAERRIGAPDYFERYFQLGVPPGDVPDSTVMAALNAINDGNEQQFEWLKGTLETHRGLVLRKMRSLWPRVEGARPERLVSLLIAAHPGVEDFRGEIFEPRLQIEVWLTELFAAASASEVERLLASALSAPRGLRLLARALSSGAQDDEFVKADGWEVAVRTAFDEIRSKFNNAVLEPVERHEDVVWMLRDATHFGDAAIVRGWVHDALDASAWRTRDFVGCFTPLAHMAGIPDAFLSDFSASTLGELLPVEEALRRLDEDLERHSTSVQRKRDVKDRDTTFENRVAHALAALAELRVQGYAGPNAGQARKNGLA